MDNYITLTSDGSLNLFPANRIGAFRSKLPHPIAVDRTKCEIGLHSITFPNKLPNIVNGFFKLRVFKKRVPYETTVNGLIVEFDDGARDLLESAGLNIATGFYSSPSDLVVALNKQIQELNFEDEDLNLKHIQSDFGIVRFTYSEQTELITIEPMSSEIYEVQLKLSEELFIKLGMGLDVNEGRIIKVPKTAKHIVDLDVGHASVFVYSDLVEKNRIVGGQITELLAVVPLTCDHNKFCHYAPVNVEYRSIRYDLIDEIQINLLGDTGQVLPFMAGKTVITLHIKDKF